MDFSNINFWAVVVVWLVNMVVGAFWYSPAGFAKQWKKYTGIDLIKLPKAEANKAIGFVAVSALIQAFTLAVLINSVGATTAKDGLIAGLVLWFGLVAATTVGVTFYSRQSWGFLWLNSSYFLLVMAVNSIILAVWH